MMAVLLFLLDVFQARRLTKLFKAIHGISVCGWRDCGKGLRAVTRHPQGLACYPTSYIGRAREKASSPLVKEQEQVGIVRRKGGGEK